MFISPCQGLFNDTKSKARGLTFKEGYGAVTSKTNPYLILIQRHSLFLKPIEMKEFNQNKA
jgi:hypothetical protein